MLHKILMIDSVLPADKKDRVDKVLKILTERCNIRKLNDEGHTPIFFATNDRI